MRLEAETGGCPRAPGAGVGRNDPPPLPETSEGAAPCNTLTLGFRPLGLCESTFLLF